MKNLQKAKDAPINLPLGWRVRCALHLQSEGAIPSFLFICRNISHTFSGGKKRKEEREVTDARNFYLRARRETNLPSLSFAGKDKFSFSGFLDVEDTMVVLNQRHNGTLGATSCVPGAAYFPVSLWQACYITPICDIACRDQ